MFQNWIGKIGKSKIHSQTQCYQQFTYAAELGNNELGFQRHDVEIVEGDIKGCFDNIVHSHITNTLLAWKVPKWSTELIANA